MPKTDKKQIALALLWDLWEPIRFQHVKLAEGQEEITVNVEEE